MRRKWAAYRGRPGRGRPPASEECRELNRAGRWGFDLLLADNPSKEAASGQGLLENDWVPARNLITSHPLAWQRAVRHPFLAGVRDGVVPVTVFDIWLGQDYLFVLDLLSFQAGLLAVAPRSAQRTLAGGLVALEAELGWFESQAKWRGLALSSDRQPATEAYRLALAKLLEDGFEPAITALWALERAYLEAWRGAAPGAPAYGEFVAHWTMPEFGEYVAELETAAGEGREAEDAFLEVCRLERGFWDMAWSAP